MPETLELIVGIRENLKRLRDTKGWSQSKAAEEAGVPVRTYQGWEAGRREPRLDALVRLARAFGVSADVLLEGVAADEPEPPARPMGKRK